MNFDDDKWGCFDDLGYGEYSIHGEFGGRLSTSVHSTTEWLGYSMWHLCAAKLCSQGVLETFLEGAANVSADVLLDDLREGMTVFPDSLRKNYLEYAPYQNTRQSWRSVRAMTAFRSPLEICKAVGYPLIWLDDIDSLDVTLHPVVKSAQIESARLIGWPLDELIL